MRKRLTVTLLTVIVSLLLISFPAFASEPKNSVVDHSNISYSLGISGVQRKSFYANGRNWVFYCDGTNILYKSSADGSSWSSSSLLASRTVALGYYVSVWLQNDTHFHYAMSSGSLNQPIYYRMGSLGSDGSIAWVTSEQNATVAEATIWDLDPVITVDSSGCPWIGFYRQKVPNDGLNGLNVTKSSYNNGTWSTASGFPTSTVTDFDTLYDSLDALTANKTCVTGGNYSGSYYWLAAKLWNGTDWKNINNSTETLSSETGFSTTANGNIVHVAYINASYYLKHIAFNATSETWSSASIIQASVETAVDKLNPSVTYDSSTNGLYCFWYDGNHVLYKYYDGSSWDTNPTTLMETRYQTSGYSTPFAGLITAFYQDYGGLIGYAVQTVPELLSGKNYEVRFGYLNYPVIGTPTTNPLKVNPEVPVNISIDVSDNNGTSNIKNASLTLPHGVVLSWVRSTDVFSLTDPYDYATLGTCSSTAKNSTAYTLAFQVTFSKQYPRGLVQVTAKVFDGDDWAETTVFPGAFTYEDVETPVSTPVTPPVEPENKTVIPVPPNIEPPVEATPQNYMLIGVIVIAAVVLTAAWSGSQKAGRRWKTDRAKKQSRQVKWPRQGSSRLPQYGNSSTEARWHKREGAWR